MRLCTLLLITLLCFPSFSQTEAQLDSIKSIIKASENDSVAIIELSNWDGLIFETNPQLDLAINLEIKKLSLKHFDSTHIGEGFFVVSLGEIYQNLGSIYQLFGDVPKCIDNYNKSLKLWQKVHEVTNSIQSLDRIGQVKIALGTVQAENGELKRADEYFLEAMPIMRKTQDSVKLAECHANLAYLTAQEILTADSSIIDSLFQLAMERNLKAVELRFNSETDLLASYNNIGALFEKVGKGDSALHYYKRSLRLSKQLDYAEAVSYTMHNISQLYYQLDNKQQALLFADSALKIAQDLQFPLDIEGPAKLLYIINKESARWRQALEMYETHVEAHNQIRNDDNDQLLLEQQARYEYEKKEAILAERENTHKAEIAAQRLQLNYQESRKFYFIASLIGVIAFLGYMIQRWRKSVRQQRTISTQKEAIEVTHSELAETYNHLEEKNKEVMDSIKYAKRIQTAILPRNKTFDELLPEAFVLYKPKDIVAGDFYWIEQFQNQVFFAAADCTGHGVPGAMVSVLCNNSLTRSVREYGIDKPGSILDKTRELVVREFQKSEEDVRDGMDVALCSLEGNKLQYAGANNPLWLIRKGDSKVLTEDHFEKVLSFEDSSGQIYSLGSVKADKQPIGKYEKNQPFETHELKLQKGDTIYLFSDGYADQFGGEKGKKMNVKRMKNLFLSLQNEPLSEQKEHIDRAFEQWRGEHEQIDDVCVIGVRV